MWDGTAPTEPGYYWFRDAETGDVKVVRGHEDREYEGDPFMCWVFFDDASEFVNKEMLEIGSFWSERILEPTEGALAS